MATNRTPQHWGTTSRPTQRRQNVHLIIGALLRNKSNKNISCFLRLRHHYETEATATNRGSYHWGTTSRSKQRQPILHLSIRAAFKDQNNGNKPHVLALRDKSNGNKSSILALGHHFQNKQHCGSHFETKATATNRTSQHWAAFHPSNRAPLRDRSNGKNRTSQYRGKTSRPKQRQHIEYLSAGAHFKTTATAPLRD